ncbi:unnamed protein product [Chondrus crispus]|uniref:Uncharacterized protein n=1 Tax=Chondrus crispus TaxID=2769 RepID=R7QM89_CHOCR|nr:unnamed protein product [Chondrus crispus]CDF38893.1 unnamed protein product [Chondrus crispus]|eukprot:XP_005718798.1 unnamed protein product [Chondrus crispus]
MVTTYFWADLTCTTVQAGTRRSAGGISCMRFVRSRKESVKVLAGASSPG